jgi:hypothetical protein
MPEFLQTESARIDCAPKRIRDPSGFSPGSNYLLVAPADGFVEDGVGGDGGGRRVNEGITWEMQRNARRARTAIIMNGSISTYLRL